MATRLRQVAGSVVLVSAVVLAAGWARAQEGGTAEAGKIVGTWLDEVTAYDCQTGVQVASFPALTSFALGGTLSSAPGAPGPAQRSPGLGTWQKVRGRTFKWVSLTFLFSPAGLLTGTQKLTGTWEVQDDPDELAGTTVSDTFDTSGTLLATVCATVVARRVKVD
jgi:hypothetical protein